jgi:serine/threonine-protein kinase
LAEDPRFNHRYNAARAAALTGGGRGKDAATLDDLERARWRQQAREWLLADLAAWEKKLDTASVADLDRVKGKLTQWQSESDLAELREPGALTKLPADEREECAQIWEEVRVVLRRAQGGG